jgi:hypothetical protein
VIAESNPFLWPPKQQVTGIPIEQQRILTFSQEAEKDAKRDGPAPRDFCKEMPSRTPKKTPGMGIPGRAFVLVYLWNHSGRHNPKGLGQKDENVQGLRGASTLAHSEGGH